MKNNMLNTVYPAIMQHKSPFDGLTSICPTTFEDLYLKELKRVLAAMGVMVHADMKGPTGEYEVFENNIATMKSVCAETLSTTGRGEDIAAHLADKYSHIAFYNHTVMEFKDSLTGEQRQYRTIRLAGW